MDIFKYRVLIIFVPMRSIIRDFDGFFFASLMPLTKQYKTKVSRRVRHFALGKAYMVYDVLSIYEACM